MPFDALTSILAVSDDAGMRSLVAQLGSMFLAAAVGRFLMKSRPAILLVSLLGVLGAMAANIMVDGQGAMAYLLFTPIVYFAAVGGRDERRMS